MAVDLGKGYVQIVPSAKGISGSIERELAPQGTVAGKTVGTRITQAIGSKLSSMGGGLMKAGAIATAVSVPIIAGIKKSLDAYKIQSGAENKLTEIYEKRMGVTKDAAQATIKYAAALQKEGVVGDEVALSGAQQLATFAKYPDTVNSLLPAMSNLLVQQKGLNGTAEDATGIANLMGKVLNGQTGALKRVGISFTEAEEQVMKYGTEEEKAAMLAKVITNNVGDMNQKMAETPEGKIQQMKNAMGDLVEQLGGVLAPVLAQIAQYLSANLIPRVEQFIGFLKANPLIAKIVVGLAAILAIGGPLLIILGSIMSAVGSIMAVVSAPLLGIVAAVIAIGAALAIAYTKVKPFRDAVNELVAQVLPIFKSLIAPMGNLLKTLATEFQSVAISVGKDLAPVIKALTPFFKLYVTYMVGVAKTVISILIPAIKIVAAVIKSVVTIVAATITTAIAIVRKLLGTAVSVVNGIKGAWNALKNATTTIFNAIKKAITSPITTAQNVLKKIVASIINLLKFSGAKSVVSSAFNAIKDAALAPFKSLKSKIDSIIRSIKGLFPINVGRILSLKLPHITLRDGQAPYGIGGVGSLPHFSVSWYAKGGIVDGATLIGAGESGAEAIVPLDTFWNRLENTQGGDTYNITVNVDAKDLDGVMSVKDFITMLQQAKAFA